MTWVRVSPSPEAFEREHPGAEALSAECFINLLRAEALLQRRVYAWAQQHGLPSINGWVVLQIVSGAGQALQPHTIAERMVLAPGTITSIVDTLERHGLVVRTRARHDARAVLIDITDQGRAVLARAHPGLNQLEREAFSCFSDQEKRAFLRLLGKLGTHLAASLQA